MKTTVLNATPNWVNQIQDRKDFCVLKSDDYRYMWSLLHRRSTNILDLDYPNNFINAIKTLYYKNQYKYIITDLSGDIFNQLESDGLIVKPFIEFYLE